MKCTIVLGCALKYLVVGYFTCVVEVVTTILGFNSFEIRSKQKP
jgi:hypothetical protein